MTMSRSGGSALYIALAYHWAWTSHDFEQAMTYIDPNIIICQAPAGPVVGADAFRQFMGPFAQILIRSELIAAYGDTDTAVLIYDTDTIPVRNAPAAEYLTVRDGRITRMRMIFDRAPFDAARRAVETVEPS
jgi:ketosteroid isomerase-like protein